MKEFETALAAVTDEEEASLEFAVVEIKEEEDGSETRTKRLCHAYPPAEGQVILFMTDTIGRHRSTEERLAAIVDFLVDVLDEESRAYIVGRLMARSDPFGLADIEPIVMWMLQEWGARPTKQPSDFAPSRKTGGQKSTPRTRVSRSSASVQTAS